ncbi:MAG: Ig-like domain-containing protein [Chthoniobacteraceae bacterium]
MNFLAGALRGGLVSYLALLVFPLGVGGAEPLIDQGETTYDPNTRLEWLDLRFTQGQSYESIRGGWGDFTTAEGYRFATAREVEQLFRNAGAKSIGYPSSPPISVNVEAAKRVLSLLGTTYSLADFSQSWMFYDPASDTSGPPTHVPTAVFGEGFIGGGYPNREGYFYVPGLYPTKDSASPEWASALVRQVPELEPQVIFYENDFEAGEASLDGLEKILSPTRGEVSATVQGGQLKVVIEDTGHAGVTRDLRIGNPVFRPILQRNRGLLTWSVNISNEDGIFNNTFTYVLASSHVDPYDINAHGYALRGGGYVGNRMILTRFSNGLGGGKSEFVEILEGLGTLPEKGSFRITFDPGTKVWNVYGKIGPSYVDPLRVTTLLGTGTDNLHLDEPLPYIALLGQVVGADYFDNVRVSMDDVPNRLPVVLPDDVSLTGTGVQLIFPLVNDEDPDGDLLRITAAEASKGSTVEIIAGTAGVRDSLRYIPSPEAIESGETLSYTVEDSEGGSATGQVNVVPAAGTPGPRLNLFLFPGEATEFSAIEGMPDPELWRIVGIEAPQSGSLSNGTDDPLTVLGRIYYAPAEGAIRKDRFVVSLMNEEGEVITRQVTVQQPPKGRFEGLYVHDTPQQEMEGKLRVNVTAGRKFTGIMQLRGRTKRFRGSFDAKGFHLTAMGATLQMSREDDELIVRSHVPETADPLSSPEANGGSGGASQELAGGWRAEAKRNRPGAVGSLAGRYTLVLPSPVNSGSGGGSAVPIRGHGWGAVRVHSSGAVTMAGAVGDGRPWSGAAFLRDNRTLLLYAPIRDKNRGVPGALAGVISFREDGPYGSAGILQWLRPRDPEKEAARSPFHELILLSRYNRPAMGALPLPAPAAMAELWHSSRVKVRIPPGNRFDIIQTAGSTAVRMNPTGFEATDAGTGSVTVRGTIRPRSGVFRGHVQDTAGGKWRFFKGVIFQKAGAGMGTFMGGDEGAVNLYVPRPEAVD